MRLRVKFVIFIAFTAMACGKTGLRYSDEASQQPNNNNSQLPAIPAGAPAGYLVLYQNCASCHGVATGGPGNVSDILNPQHLINSGLAIPSNPDASPIMVEIVAGRMPPGGALTAPQIADVRQWIADGLPLGSGAPTPPPLPPLAPTYSSLAANIFIPKCIACHGPTLASDGIRLDSFNGVRREVNLTTPNQSKLYTTTASGDMPQAPNPRLSNAEVTAIYDWIATGALNN